MTMTHRISDVNGWWEVKRNPISKVGVFPYYGRQISPELEPDRLYQVYRPAEELADPETIASFRLIPWVDDHHMLGSEAMGLTPAEKKGVHGVIGENVFFEGDTLYGNVKVFSQYLADAINAGKRELSCGYRCIYDLTPGEYKGIRYDAVQRKPRGNHLASVSAGRMGPDVAVLDHMTFTVDAKDLEPMKKTALQLAQAALAAAQDAKAPEAVIAACDASVKAAQDTETSEAETAAKAKEEADKKAADEMEAKAKEDKDAADKIAADAIARAKTAGQDAAVLLAGDLATANATIAAQAAQLTAQDARLKVLETGALDAKAVITEVAQRDALAEKLSFHVGVFDHADKTLAEVVKYGMDKLELTAPAGHEQTALSAYLAAKGTPKPATDSANDAKPAAGFVARFDNGEDRKSA